jgi:ACR3 family arsenite efflux pump ArsB
MLRFLVLGIVLALVMGILGVGRHIDIVGDIPTNLYQSLFLVLCRRLCPILSRIRVSDSCILGRDSQRNSLLLFQSWVLSPMVLFYLLLAFFISPLFRAYAHI